MQWCDESNEGFYTAISKGRRLIVVHAGGSDWFIRNALLIFKSGCISGTYHDDMNYQNFSKWVETQLNKKFASQKCSSVG